MERGHSWEANSRSASQEKFPLFIEHKSFLPYSQGIVIDPCPMPDKSNQLPEYYFPKPILMLLFHLSFGLMRCLFTLGLPSKILIHFSFTLCSICPAHTSFFWFVHHNYICWTVKIMELRIMLFLPPFFHLFPFRFKYSSKHPVIEHPQFMFFL
jgi:hypothetical protein